MILENMCALIGLFAVESTATALTLTTAKTLKNALLAGLGRRGPAA